MQQLQEVKISRKPQEAGEFLGSRSNPSKKRGMAGGLGGNSFKEVLAGG